MKLGDADQREEVGLIDGERFLERGPFALGIPEDAAGRREIDPVRRFARLALARDLEMGGSGAGVRPREGIGTEPIAGRGFFAVEGENRFEMGAGGVAESRVTSALRSGQLLPDTVGRHAAIQAERPRSVKQPRDRSAA